MGSRGAVSETILTSFVTASNLTETVPAVDPGSYFDAQDPRTGRFGRVY
jgi:hypothetical protein